MDSPARRAPGLQALGERTGIEFQGTEVQFEIEAAGLARHRHRLHAAQVLVNRGGGIQVSGFDGVTGESFEAL